MWLVYKDGEHDELRRAINLDHIESILDDKDYISLWPDRSTDDEFYYVKKEKIIGVWESLWSIDNDIFLTEGGDSNE